MAVDPHGQDPVVSWLRYEAYSHQGRKKWGRKAFSFIVRALIVAVVLYILVTGFFLRSFIVHSSSMSPAIEAKERVFVSPIVYGFRIPFVKNPYREIRSPERGDIVAIVSPVYPDVPPVKEWLDAVIRFTTAQMVSIVRDGQGNRISPYSIKRIIGIPGDAVRLGDYAASIRPRTRREFVPESELIVSGYIVNDEPPVANWPKSLPFSGDMGERVLGEDEYFVLGDNRPFSSDSRSWGPVALDRIRGKIVLRYWPLGQLGRP